jgi:hypothetical protein
LAGGGVLSGSFFALILVYYSNAWLGQVVQRRQHHQTLLDNTQIAPSAPADRF